MKDLAQLAVLTAVVAAPSWADSAERATPPAPALTREHVHPSGAFVFRTPGEWTVDAYGPSPQVLEAKGDGVVVRFLHRPDESGFDSLHVSCMLERLAGPMESEPRVEYEYDFLSGKVGERRILDSAFKVHYDRAVMGHKDWRQRNLTVVGQGQSLCVITYCPVPLWKKSAPTRSLLEGVVSSVSFRPWP